VSGVVAGAEEWSHVADGARGALVVHGFTGNPSSMRGLAEAFAAAGFDVELPRLAGHGTAVADMVPTRWSDWSRDADAAHARLASRCRSVVVAGLSMGGSLTLWLGARHPEIAGLVCVNPATMPLPDEMMGALHGMADQGVETFPAIGSDIADPDVTESSYDATPIAALISMFRDGVVPLSAAYGAMRMPLQLFTSVNDHVVDPSHSEFLAGTYGGPIERVSLERSFHVATQDYDKHLIFERAVGFASRVAP
jgi:carboxylesterase